MARPFQRLCTALALLAMVAMLVFGGAIRYLCFCEGSPVLTAHDHGHHGHDCDHEHSPGGHEDHDHESVKVPTELRLTKSTFAPELKLCPLFLAPDPAPAEPLTHSSRVDRPNPLFAGGPPLPHAARTAVLRI